MSSLSPGDKLGAYRIVQQIGAGGMGAVYEARQEPLERRVAIKTLLPLFATNKTALERFFTEGKVLSSLEHPSLVQVSDYGTTADGMAYLVLEYLRGESLGARIRQLAASGQAMPVDGVLQVGWQVAAVLALAHSRGIVHRDIKPDNLMLVSDPVVVGGERVKVLDFGIAKLVNQAEVRAQKTKTQAVLGTPMYMSPEQCRGAAGVEPASDVYSLGCVLFETLAKRPPFVADGIGALITMQLFDQPPDLRQLAPQAPALLVELIERMLDKKKEKRPTMDVIADSLSGMLAHQGKSARSVPSPMLPPTQLDLANTSPTPPLVAEVGVSRAVSMSWWVRVRTQLSERRGAALWLGGVSALGLIGFASSHLVSNPRGDVQPVRTASSSPPPVTMQTPASLPGPKGTQESSQIHPGSGVDAGDERARPVRDEAATAKSTENPPAAAGTLPVRLPANQNTVLPTRSAEIRTRTKPALSSSKIRSLHHKQRTKPAARFYEE